MKKITHLFLEPTDVVVETIGDEIILCINRGYASERSFAFLRVDIDIFDGEGNIIMGLKNPAQLESFFEFKAVNIVIHEIDGAAIGTVEMHYG
jgi:hypothetical protein